MNPSCIINDGSYFIPFWINFGSLLGAQAVIALLLPVKYYFIEVHRKQGGSSSSDLSREVSTSSVSTSEASISSPVNTSAPPSPAVPTATVPKAHWDSMRQHLRASWVRATIILLLFQFSNMAYRTFQVVVCVRVFGEYVLASSPAQVCFQGYHNAAFGIGFLVLLFYIIGLPLALLVILVYYHQKGRLEDTEIAKMFAYLTDSFKPHTFFTGVLWLVVLLFQGLSLALAPFPLTELLLSVLPFSFFGVYLAVLRPFERVVLNYLSISLIAFVVIIQIFSYAHLSQTAYYITGIVFFGACMAIVVPLVGVPLAAYLHNFYFHRLKAGGSSGTLKKEGVVVSQMRLGGGMQKQRTSKQSQMEMTLFSPDQKPF